MLNESGNRSQKFVTHRTSIRIRFDYPLDKVRIRTFKSSNGFTVSRFLRCVNSAYRDFERRNQMWGHCFADLGFEGYKHLGHGLYRVEIGS